MITNKLRRARNAWLIEKKRIGAVNLVAPPQEIPDAIGTSVGGAALRAYRGGLELQVPLRQPALLTGRDFALRDQTTGQAGRDVSNPSREPEKWARNFPSPLSLANAPPMLL